MADKEVVVVENNLIEILRHMSPENLTELQQAVRAEKKKRIKPRGKFVTGYISKNDLPVIDIVMDWLFERGYLKKRTFYNLTSFALTLTINEVRGKIKREALESET